MGKTRFDLEKDKFTTNDDGETVVRTTATGEFTFSGLKNGGEITMVTLNDSTWTALPLSPLASRNALTIQNRSGIEIKINYDNSVSGYVGLIIPTSGERYYDISETIVIYAKSASGTPEIAVEELS